MKRRLILLLAVLLAASVGLTAKDKPGKREKHHRQGEESFRQHERTVILDYYGAETSGLPPGLAKRGGDLPPGLEKQLRRNGHLPPGLQKRLVPFPVQLERRLPPCPTGYRRGVIGGIAVIWNSRTGIIVDTVLLGRH